MRAAKDGLGGHFDISIEASTKNELLQIVGKVSCWMSPSIYPRDLGESQCSEEPLWEPLSHFAKQAILSTAGKIVNWQRLEQEEKIKRAKNSGGHFNLYNIIETYACGCVRFTNVSVFCDVPQRRNPVRQLDEVDSLNRWAPHTPTVRVFSRLQSSNPCSQRRPVWPILVGVALP